MTNSSIAIKTNTARLIQSLEVTFSNKNKVLSEVIQNSRRAGATAVSIEYKTQADSDLVSKITISDDGIGLSDLQDIFTIGESSWDDDVQSKENPYGIGSIAMLFACKTLKISSLGKCVEVDTQQVIDGNAFEVKQTNTPSKGTKISLCDTVFKKDTLTNALRYIAETSSIPIVLNHEPLPRPYCLESLKQNPDYLIFDTPLGTLATRQHLSLNFNVVLQDLIVHRFSHSRDDYFFANQTFKARMPDRDKLIDEKEQIARIQVELITVFTHYLTDEKAKVFLDKEALYEWTRSNFNSLIQFAPALLNDIDLLPTQAFTMIDYPCCRDNCYWAKTTDVHKNNVPVNCYIQVECNAPIVLAALCERDSQRLNVKLDANHWFYDQAEEFDCDEVEFIVNDAKKVATWICIDSEDCKMSVASSLSVKYKDWTQDITDGAFFIDRYDSSDYMFGSEDEEKSKFEQLITQSIDEYGQFILLNVDDVESVLLQFSDFMNDLDQHDDLYLSQTVEEVTQYATAELGMSASEFIINRLPSLPDAIINQLKTSPVTLSVDENGMLTTLVA